MKTGKNSLILCGGGVDSYVAAWKNQQQYPTERTILLYVDYGAKAGAQEKHAVTLLCSAMNSRFGASVVSVRVISTDFWSKYLFSPLTSKKTKIEKSPTAGVASEWVPARNTVLMAMALAVAENHGFARIVCGINATAAVAYPDNSVAWIDSYRILAKYAMDRNRSVSLEAPLAELKKSEIIDLAYEIGMTQEILGKSWSCYDSGVLHCGKCSSCRARKNAFLQSIWNDPTKY